MDETDRLASLRQYVAAGVDVTSAFQQVAQLAADLFAAPIALVSVIEDNHQIFRGAVGADVTELYRYMPACEWVLADDGLQPLVIHDRQSAPSLDHYPQGHELQFGFCAGVVIRAANGEPAGTLLILDSAARPDLTVDSLRRMHSLAAIAASHARITSEHQEQAAQLEESHERQRWLGAAESVADLGHWRWELRTGRRWWSEGFFRILGLEPAEAPRSTEELYDGMSETDRNRLIAGMMRARDFGEDFSLEVARLRGDGEQRMVLVKGLAQQGADGRVEVIFGVAQDITEKHNAQAKLATALEAAEAGSRAKAEFLANMSHEIRTPLSAIIGFGGLLKGRDDLSDEAERYADRIVTAGQGLMSLVNDILDFSKIDAGQLELELQPFTVRELIEDCTGLVGLQAAGKQLSLHASVEVSTPTQLLGDGERLRQIVLNLLSNAVKFTAEGGVQVRCGYGAGALRIEVQDTGVGLSPDQQSRLFQRFFQADASIHRTFGGTGLGLSICRGLAELMGGRIGVESQEGVGSTFWVELPMEEVRADDHAVGPDEEAEAGPLRILVVDDVEVNRELVRTILGSCGHLVSEAPGGAEAIEIAIAQPFDVILMDVHMPSIDGLAATRAIRANSKVNRITPIVALTADARPQRVVECTAAGMNGFLTKPISVTGLLSTLARVCEESDQAHVAA